MGDYYSGSITIGGRVPAELLEEFMTLLKEEEVTLNWGGISFSPTSSDEIVHALSPDGYLEFYNDDLRNGCYETLEEWLRTHRIGFIRSSGSCGEYLPEVVHYRKGMGLRSYLTNENGCPLIHVDLITKACDTLVAGRPERAYHLLRSATPNHLPALPPLTIGKPSHRRTKATQRTA